MNTEVLVFNKKPSFDEFMKGLRSFRTGEGEQAFSDEYHVITNKEKNFWLETYESEGYIELGDYESAYVNEHDVIQVEK